MVQKGANYSEQFFDNLDSEMWLTVTDASRYLSLSANALRLMVHRGQVRSYKLGRRLRFRKRDLDALLKYERSAR